MIFIENIAYLYRVKRKIKGTDFYEPVSEILQVVDKLRAEGIAPDDPDASVVFDDDFKSMVSQVVTKLKSQATNETIISQANAKPSEQVVIPSIANAKPSAAVVAPSIANAKPSAKPIPKPVLHPQIVWQQPSEPVIQETKGEAQAKIRNQESGIKHQASSSRQPKSGIQKTTLKTIAYRKGDYVQVKDHVKGKKIPVAQITELVKVNSKTSYQTNRFGLLTDTQILKKITQSAYQRGIRLAKQTEFAPKFKVGDCIAIKHPTPSQPVFVGKVIEIQPTGYRFDSTTAANVKQQGTFSFAQEAGIMRIKQSQYDSFLRKARANQQQQAKSQKHRSNRANGLAIPIIQRFLKETKSGDRTSVSAALSVIQRAERQGRITKADPYAPVLRYIANQYKTALKGYAPYRPSPSEKELMHLVALSKSTQVFPTVAFINQYIGTLGKPLTPAQIAEMLTKAEQLINTQGRTEPLYGHVRQVAELLRQRQGQHIDTPIKIGLSGSSRIKTNKIP